MGVINSWINKEKRHSPFLEVGRTALVIFGVDNIADDYENDKDNRNNDADDDGDDISIADSARG